MITTIINNAHYLTRTLEKEQLLLSFLKNAQVL